MDPQTTQPNPSKSNKLLIIFILTLIIIVLPTLIILVGYFSYQYGKNSCEDKISDCTSESTSTTTSVDENIPPAGWKTVEEETDLIYFTANIPQDMVIEAKMSDLYITLKSDDNFITLYISGECEGCTVVPAGNEVFVDDYEIGNENLIINGDTCSRDAYISKITNQYELYEVSCLDGDEEIHIWGTCKDTIEQIGLCDEIVEGMVVENL